MLTIEIPYRDPLAAFAPFAGDPVCAFLDSAAPGDPRGRWSYIAAAPFEVITATADGVRIDGRIVAGDPFGVLAARLKHFRAKRSPLRGHKMPSGNKPAHTDNFSADAAEIPFRGGAIGFLGYELGRHLERLPAPHPAAPPLPDMVVGLYDVVLAFDQWKRRAFLVSSGAPERDAAARALRARARAEEIRTRLDAPAPPEGRAPGMELPPERPRAEVEAAIARAIGYIGAGDIFQANITQRFSAPWPGGDDFALYRRLRALSPAPFAAFLRCGADLTLASASPERFLRLSPEGAVETRPIKGTRRRHADPLRDAAEAAALTTSAKDRAENLMIADLMRNDLGRVSETGSVRVPVLCGLESFASVHHLVSVVEARLRPGLGAVDLLRAAFPGGSVTGAPKIRAMEIIHELEGAPRGPYCGAVAWMGFDGAMDSSIVIRTLVRAGDRLVAQAGGGIVADSVPADEYEESLVKIAPLLKAARGDAR